MRAGAGEGPSRQDFWGWKNWPGETFSQLLLTHQRMAERGDPKYQPFLDTHGLSVNDHRNHHKPFFKKFNFIYSRR